MSNINYVHVLSEKEYEDSLKQKSKEISAWWKSLDLDDRELIYRQFQELLQQRDCEHKWVKMPIYGKPITTCVECKIIKKPAIKRVPA